MPTKLSGRAAVRGQVKVGVADAAEQSLDLDPFSVASRHIMVVDASRECDRRSARFGLLPDAYNRIGLMISNCGVKQLSKVRFAFIHVFGLPPHQKENRT